MSLFGGFSVPPGGLFSGLLNTISIGVTQTQIVLRKRNPLVGSLPIPLDSLFGGLLHAISVVIACTQIVLRKRIPRFGRLPIPLNGFLPAFILAVLVGQGHLCTRVSPFSEFFNCHPS